MTKHNITSAISLKSNVSHILYPGILDKQGVEYSVYAGVRLICTEILKIDTRWEMFSLPTDMIASTNFHSTNGPLIEYDTNIKKGAVVSINLWKNSEVGPIVFSVQSLVVECLQGGPFAEGAFKNTFVTPEIKISGSCSPAIVKKGEYTTSIEYNGCNIELEIANINREVEYSLLSVVTKNKQIASFIGGEKIELMEEISNREHFKVNTTNTDSTHFYKTIFTPEASESLNINYILSTDIPNCWEDKENISIGAEIQTSFSTFIMMKGVKEGSQEVPVAQFNWGFHFTYNAYIGVVTIDSYPGNKSFNLVENEKLAMPYWQGSLDGTRKTELDYSTGCHHEMKGYLDIVPNVEDL